MDARQPAPVESSDDRDSLVCYRSTSSSAAAVTATHLLKPIVLPTAAVRDLEVFIDADLSMKTHVARTVSARFAVMRMLRSIRRSVPRPVLQKLVTW